jgi:hypothetical protein
MTFKHNLAHMTEHLQAIKLYQSRECTQINQMSNLNNYSNGHIKLIFKDNSKHHQALKFED